MDDLVDSVLRWTAIGAAAAAAAAGAAASCCWCWPWGPNPDWPIPEDSEILDADVGAGAGRVAGWVAMDDIEGLWSGLCGGWRYSLISRRSGFGFSSAQTDGVGVAVRGSCDWG